MGSKWVLLLGVVFGIIAAVLAYFKLDVDEEVVLAGQSFMKLNSSVNLAKGDRLSSDLITGVEIPLEFTEVGSVAVPYSDEVVAWLDNHDVRVSQDVSSGAFILHEHLIDNPDERFSTIISEKNRAISIPVSQLSAVSYFIEPGSRVDILATFTVTEETTEAVSSGFGQTADLTGGDLADAFDFQQQKVVTRTMFQNMLVLAVGQATTRNAYLNFDSGYSAVTLDVTLEEAELLTFMMSQADGGFNLVLRNPANTEKAVLSEVDWDVVTDTK
jgi:Flp pilus assembly protein CpaB